MNTTVDHKIGCSSSSRLRAQEWVEVRSKDEILATLDANGCYEGLPFMPEMFEYCGRRMQVSKRAHKTCDYVSNSGIRALPSAVHLENARCSGASHGGCDARCLLYWKDVWLRPAEGAGEMSGLMSTRPSGTGQADEAAVMERCTNGMGGDDLRYICQATLVPSFTTPLSWWNVGQFVEDYSSGNVRSFRDMLSSFTFRVYDNLINLGVGLGPGLRYLYNAVQRLRGGMPYPATSGPIAQGGRTPTLSLNLRPGDRVRVKTHDEILSTLDASGRNRGMIFSQEMVPYCGKEFHVLGTVSRLVDEKTGKLIHLKNPCIILDGVICHARYLKNMLFCPRATFPYWREIWLERVDA